MKTFGLSDTHIHRLRILAVFASLVLALPAQASFHLMQIEQVIGGVNGDTTAQAVQLRMRFGGQEVVAGATLVAFDASGNNPITLVTFPSNVSTAAAGSRILIATPEFASHETSPIASDFTMTAIPASYLAAGRLSYQKPTYQNGNTLWSVSWGGAIYTGPNTGSLDNDADGNFAPPFAGLMPSKSTVALQYTGAASAQSTNNAADYALTTGPVTFTNNAGASTSLIGGTVDSKLANISTRAFVQTGDDVLIGGLIVLGQNSLRVIVRAIGPSLPLPGALADPTLELHDSDGALIVANDNWRSDQESEIIATGIPPSSDMESAIVRDLAPGGYTAIVRGANNTTGIAVVEAYALN